MSPTSFINSCVIHIHVLVFKRTLIKVMLITLINEQKKEPVLKIRFNQNRLLIYSIEPITLTNTHTIVGKTAHLI